MEEDDTSKVVTIIYTNWRGETSQRRILSIKLWFGKTEWHPREQWLLKAQDVDKNVERDFALKDIAGWKSPE